MTNRISPSLNWLIDKPARIAGGIEKNRNTLCATKALIKELEDLEKKLTAVDTTLKLHDIKIDVNIIKSVKSKYYRLNIPHGELKKPILTCIKL